MDAIAQQQILSDMGNIPVFEDRISGCGLAPFMASGIDILQMNVGCLCNLTCKHCHVNASPLRTEVMSKEIMELCLGVAQKYPINTIDITGGAPEMNPHIAWFLEEAAQLKKRLILRSNLVILQNPQYHAFMQIFRKCNVELVASMPDFHAEGTDRQRGKGVFSSIIEVMTKLNREGFGMPNSPLKLHLVYNPVGAFLPGSQSALAYEYKKKLREEYDIHFSELFCIANNPIGRFLDFLLRTDNFTDYMESLSLAFNPMAAQNAMCRTTLSVGWDGTLYDCDFNQMLEMKVNHGAPHTIANFDFDKLRNRRIRLHNHCYACTAGAGSSCQGATQK